MNWRQRDRLKQRLMWWMWVVLSVVAVVMIGYPVFADHIPILKGKVKVVEAFCPIGKEGKMDKNSRFYVPCSMGVDPNVDTRFWVAIENTDGIILWVIEVNVSDSSQRIVWKLGEVET